MTGLCCSRLCRLFLYLFVTKPRIGGIIRSRLIIIGLRSIKNVGILPGLSVRPGLAVHVTVPRLLCACIDRGRRRAAIVRGSGGS